MDKHKRFLSSAADSSMPAAFPYDDDDPFINGMYSAISFHSLLNINHPHPHPHPHPYPIPIPIPPKDKFPCHTNTTDLLPHFSLQQCYSYHPSPCFPYAAASQSSVPLITSLLNQNFQLPLVEGENSIHLHSDSSSTAFSHHQSSLKSIDLLTDSNFKAPKQKSSASFNHGLHLELEFDQVHVSEIREDSALSSFRQLPKLRSLEQVQAQIPVSEDPQKKKRKAKYYFPPTPQKKCNPNAPILFRSFQHHSSTSTSTAPYNVKARIRRQWITEKTRILQELMPWERKMDTSTLLGEAYKYVKFLQAQISVLQSMPAIVDARNPPSGCCNSSNSDGDSDSNVYGALGKLNRQQLLQVLVNSPVAQTLLYSRGCCVFSVEQLRLLNNIAQRNATAFYYHKQQQAVNASASMENRLF